MKRSSGLLLAWILTAAVAPVHAAIIRVEKDGSGDYTTLQAGLDAAQPGDTLRIGPGRYDTFTLTTFDSGGTVQIVGRVSTPGIIIEGTDRNLVRIGPVPPRANIGGISTGGIGVDQGVPGVTIRNLTAENMEFGIGCNSDSAVFEDLDFRSSGGATGLQISGTDGTIIRNCFFTGARFQGIWLVAQAPSRNALIEGCTVEATGSWGMDIGTAQNVTVRNCALNVLTPHSGSIQFWNGAQGSIENCTFTGTGGNLHVGVGFNTDLRMDNNTCQAGAIRSLYVVSGRVHGTGNFFGGGTFTTIEILGQGSIVDLQNGTIEHLGKYSVRAITELDSGTDFIGLRNNYWGASDSTQIADWILDGNDAPEGSPLAPVLFTPFLDHIVGTESTTMGSLKALFANPK